MAERASWFNNVVSWFANDGVTADELQRQSDLADSQKDILDAQRRDQYGEEWYADVQRNETRDEGTYDLNVNADLDREWNAGIAEGQANISRTIGGGFDIIGKGIGGVLGGIPPWLWLAAAVALFFYFGGAKLLKRHTA